MLQAQGGVASYFFNDNIPPRHFACKNNLRQRPSLCSWRLSPSKDRRQIQGPLRCSSKARIRDILDSLAGEGYGVLLSRFCVGIDGSSLEGRFIALKVMTADALHGEKHIDELNILRRTSSASPRHPGHSRIVQLLDHFEYTGPHGLHLCLVLEVLGPSLGALGDLYRSTEKREVPSAIPKRFTKQILLGLDYLHHSCGIVHTGTSILVRTTFTPRLAAE